MRNPWLFTEKLGSLQLFCFHSLLFWHKDPVHKGFDRNVEKNETKIDVKAESKILYKCLIFQERQLNSIQDSSFFVLWFVNTIISKRFHPMKAYRKVGSFLIFILWITKFNATVQIQMFCCLSFGKTACHLNCWLKMTKLHVFKIYQSSLFIIGKPVFRNFWKSREKEKKTIHWVPYLCEKILSRSIKTGGYWDSTFSCMRTLIL